MPPRAFGDSMDAGRKHPFLFPLAYRTRGWQWDFGRLACGTGDSEAVGSLSAMVKELLKHFLAAAVESSPDDLHVEFSVRTHLLRVLDSAPVSPLGSRPAIILGTAGQNDRTNKIFCAGQVSIWKRDFQSFSSSLSTTLLGLLKESHQGLKSCVRSDLSGAAGRRRDRPLFGWRSPCILFS
jgi:hypothetical protein